MASEIGLLKLQQSIVSWCPSDSGGRGRDWQPMIQTKKGAMEIIKQVCGKANPVWSTKVASGMDTRRAGCRKFDRSSSREGRHPSRGAPRLATIFYQALQIYA